MGHHVDRLRAGPLSRRQRFGSAGSPLRVSPRVRRRARPDSSIDRTARPLGPTDAAAFLERLRHQARDLRRRLRGLALERRRRRRRHQPAGALRRQERRHDAARASRSGAMRSTLPSVADLTGRKLAVSFHVAGESGPMTWHAKALTTSYLTRARRRSQGTTRGRVRVSVHHHLLVLPRRRGHDGAGRHAVDRSVRRFDHRRHGLHLERRRSLAQRALAASARRLRQSCRGGERGHRRQPGGRTGGVLGRRIPSPEVPRRGSGWSAMFSVSPASPPSSGSKASTTSAPMPTPQSKRWRPAMKEVVSRLRATLPGVRVIGATVVSALGSTNAAHGSAAEDREAEDAQRVHPPLRPVRRRRRLRPGDARPADRQPARRVRPRQHHRRPRRQAAPQPGRLSGDGNVRRFEVIGAP